MELRDDCGLKRPAEYAIGIVIVQPTPSGSFVLWGRIQFSGGELIEID